MLNGASFSHLGTLLVNLKSHIYWTQLPTNRSEIIELMRNATAEVSQKCCKDSALGEEGIFNHTSSTGDDEFEQRMG